MLRTETERRAPPGGPPAGPPSDRGRHHRRSRWRVWRRRLAVVVILALVPIGWSWGHAVTVPGNGGVAVSTVEWIRSHGGGWLVAGIENFWYRLHAPPKGGKPPPGYIRPSPRAPRARTASPPGTARTASPPATACHATGPPHLPAPKPIPTIAKPALAGEGVWHPAGRKVDGLPAVYVADIRPDTVHTSLVTGVAWMDPKLLTAKMFAGSEEPGDGPWPYASPIPPSMRRTLVATFNSGFKMQDAHGGYYAYGKLAQPLVRGAASLVIYKNGTVNVGSWGTEVRMTPEVAAVRQNLTLIIDHGHLGPPLRGGERPLGVIPGQRPPPRRGGEGHGDGHQLRVDDVLHLRPGTWPAGWPRQRPEAPARHGPRRGALLPALCQGLHRHVRPPTPRGGQEVAVAVHGSLVGARAGDHP